MPVHMPTPTAMMSSRPPIVGGIVDDSSAKLTNPSISAARNDSPPRISIANTISNALRSPFPDKPALIIPLSISPKSFLAACSKKAAYRCFRSRREPSARRETPLP